MESTLSAQDAGLIEALDFRLPQVASYVTSREEVSFAPSGNTFASSGVRTLRIPISGGAFVDASSITVEATLTNLDGTNLLTATTCSLAGFLEELHELREASRTAEPREGEGGSRERSLPGAGLPSQHNGHPRLNIDARHDRAKPEH